MDQRVDLFVIAGEPSSDLLGAELISHLTHLNIEAVAGPKMRALPINAFSQMEKLCSMGFVRIVKSLPRIAREFYKIRRRILKLNPRAVVCIDYPGFNLRLQRSLRKKGYKGQIIHYVCPSVWAWGKGRIKLLEENVNLLLCLFPFEKECFMGKQLQVEYVGHPLTSKIKASQEKRDNTLAIFPGSRTSEIEKNLNVQLKAATRIQKIDPKLKIIVSISQPNKRALIESIAKEYPCSFASPDEGYQLMKRARLAIATSGTVNLELALHKTPTIVNYWISSLDEFLATTVFKINLPHYSIVNIIAKREIFPEFFGSNLTVDALTHAVEKAWKNPFAVPALLEEICTSQTAAKMIEQKISIH